MKSPFPDWRSLLVRVKVKTASEIFLGALVELADSGTAKVVEKTADKSRIVFGIVPDCFENRNQLQIDNSGAAITKLLFFAANSYIYVMPLIPGMIVSARFTASVAAHEIGMIVCSDANGAFRRMAAVATDVEPNAAIGRLIGGDITNGTGVQYAAVVII
jgi:hypothetical protein